MNETSKLILPQTEPPLLEKVDLPGVTGIFTLEIDKLALNSVLVIKIEPEGMRQRMAATQQIAMAIRPHTQTLREKGVVLLVMAASESINEVTEEQMNQMGWFKKEESRIIKPFGL